MQVDVNEFRDISRDLQNLKNIDDRYIFYNDETNNSRKFHIEKGVFNTSEKENFILGGVLHLKKSKDINVNELFDTLNLQKTIKEVKFKYIVKFSKDNDYVEDFIEMLGSTKLNKCIRWISDNQLYIHYRNFNMLYYSIVDIVDSAIISSEIKGFDRYFVDTIKNDLYSVLSKEIEETKTLFYKYDYPNIKKIKIQSFIDELLGIIEPYMIDQYLGISMNILSKMLKVSKYANSLPFIMDEKNHILIDNFSQIFMSPLRIFKNSFHFFDNEVFIEDILNGYEFLDEGRIINHYKFVDSKECEFIQLSDVVVGLLGKYYSFIRNSSKNEIWNIVAGLDMNSYESLKLINDLILESSNICNGFIMNVTSLDELSKQEYILSL